MSSARWPCKWASSPTHPAAAVSSSEADYVMLTSISLGLRLGGGCGIGNSATSITGRAFFARESVQCCTFESRSGCRGVTERPGLPAFFLNRSLLPRTVAWAGFEVALITCTKRELSSVSVSELCAEELPRSRYFCFIKDQADATLRTFEAVSRASEELD